MEVEGRMQTNRSRLGFLSNQAHTKTRRCLETPSCLFPVWFVARAIADALHVYPAVSNNEQVSGVELGLDSLSRWPSARVFRCQGVIG